MSRHPTRRLGSRREGLLPIDNQGRLIRSVNLVEPAESEDFPQRHLVSAEEIAPDRALARWRQLRLRFKAATGAERWGSTGSHVTDIVLYELDLCAMFPEPSSEQAGGPISISTRQNC
jgi:hypothetical protein